MIIWMDYLQNESNLENIRLSLLIIIYWAHRPLARLTYE